MKFNNCDLASDVPPPGRYRVIVASTREAKSRAGNLMVKVTLTILDGPHAGKTIRDYFVIAGGSPAAVTIGRRRLAALFRATGIEPQPNQEVDVGSLDERTAAAEVEHEIAEGATRARVRYYLPSTNAASS